MRTSVSYLVAAWLLATATEAAPATSSTNATEHSLVTDLLGDSLIHSTPCKRANGSPCGERDLASQAVALAKNFSAQSFAFDFGPNKNIYALSSNVAQIAAKLNASSTAPTANCSAATHGGLFFFDLGCMAGVDFDSNGRGLKSSMTRPPPSGTRPSAGPTGDRGHGRMRPTGSAPPSSGSTLSPRADSLNDLLKALSKQFSSLNTNLANSLAKFFSSLSNNSGYSTGNPLLNGDSSKNYTSLASCVGNVTDCLSKFIPKDTILASRTCASGNSSSCSESDIAKAAAQLATSLRAPAYAYTTNGSIYALSVDASRFGTYLNATASLKTSSPACKFFSIQLLNAGLNVLDRGCATNPSSTSTTRTTTKPTPVASVVAKLVNITTTELKKGLGATYLSKLVNSSAIISAQRCSYSSQKVCTFSDLYSKSKALAASTGGKAYGYTPDGKIVSFNVSTTAIASILKVKAKVRTSSCSELSLPNLRVLDVGCSTSSVTSASATVTGQSTMSYSTLGNATNGVTTPAATSTQSLDSSATTEANVEDSSTTSDVPSPTTTEANTDDTTTSDDAASTTTEIATEVTTTAESSATAG